MNSAMILSFWFDQITADKWWKKDLHFDQLIRRRFGKIHAQAARGELSDWRRTAKGRLAEVLILDQFSRNLYRDMPEAFAQDGQALVLAQEAIRIKADQTLPALQRLFLYMPFMHSESSVIHEQAVLLFTELGLPNNLEFEFKHKAIIDKFGRYPHRNSILGRVSTQAETLFLTQPGSTF